MKTRKIVLVGIDSLVPQLVEKFVKEGKLPNMKQMMEKGAYSRALPALPALTPTNWTTIATGADPLNHGVTCYYAHYPGDPLDKLSNGFSSEYCQAEQIWTTAEKEGKKPIVIEYPNSYPVNIKNGIHVGEYGCPGRSEKQITYCMCYATEKYRNAVKVTLRSASNWNNLPKSYQDPLETTILIQPLDWQVGWGLPKPKEGAKAKEYNVLIVDTRNEGYDQVIISETKDAYKAVAILSKGSWSKWLITDFTLKEGTREAAFRMKLIELSPDGKKFKLYISQIYPTKDFTYPSNLSDELFKECGPYQPLVLNNRPIRWDWVDLETFKEETEYTANWLAKAASYLLKNKEWDLVLMKWHSPDQVQHAFWQGIDPLSPVYDPKTASQYWDIIAWNYGVADSILGRVIDTVDSNTVIMLVSDHGHIAHIHTIMMNDLLASAGLLTFNDRGRVNWNQTKAFAQRMMYIYVNLKGRDPEGIVSRGKEYEEVCEKIITTLLDLKDPRTGQHPITFALKREDAISLGIGGDRVGDIVYAMTPGYAGLDNRERYGKVIPGDTEVESVWGLSHHGQNLGSVDFSIGSIKAVWAMMGGGVKKGYHRRVPISLRDIAPTISYICGMQPPAQCDGKVIFDAFG